MGSAGGDLAPMDRPSQGLVDYALSLSNNPLLDRQVDAVVTHLLDTTACALGGYRSPPAVIARRIARSVVADDGATVLGMATRTTPEYAAFANSVMVRYLDYNDLGPAGHPSDMIPATWAVAEQSRATGMDVVKATFAIYEVMAAIGRNGGHVLGAREKGIDQVFVPVGAAVGAGVLLGLSPEQFGHAISLSLVPNIPLRVTRTGRLSAWKGCATADGAMRGVWAARLAKEGMTGPSEPFDGVDGLRQVIGIEVDSLEDIGQPVDGLSAIEASALRYFPAEFGSQGTLETVLQMLPRFDVADIERIHIAVFYSAWHEIGGGQGDHDEKWDPQTRETADHSLPYLVAAALTDGEFTVDSLAPERIADPSLRPLMDKIEVDPDPELTRAFEKEGVFDSEWPSIVTVELKDGSRISERSSYPKGMPRNPMSEVEVASKFKKMSEGVMTPGQSESLVNAVRGLPGQESVTDLFALFRQVDDGHG